MTPRSPTMVPLHDSRSLAVTSPEVRVRVLVGAFSEASHQGFFPGTPVSSPPLSVNGFSQ